MNIEDGIVINDTTNIDQQSGIRSKRSSQTDKKGGFQYAGYLDAIGQPRGIPHEFKARSEVAAGFEAILPMIGVSKNAEWINYLYYNVARFINYTTDALSALGEQLDATSRVAMQNFMILDWILAKEGGVSAKVGPFCCTYIPNNTAPDGAFTKAMDKLRDLRDEVTANAGQHASFDTAIETWFKGTLGGVGSWFARLGIIVGICLLVFVLVFSLFLPCLRTIVLRTVAGQSSTQMPVMLMNKEHMATLMEVNPGEKQMDTDKGMPSPMLPELTLLLKEWNADNNAMGQDNNTANYLVDDVALEVDINPYR